MRGLALMLTLVCLGGCDKKKATGAGATGSGDEIRVSVKGKALRLTLRATWRERHQPYGDPAAKGRQGILVVFPRDRGLGIAPLTASKALDVVLVDSDRRILRVAPGVAAGSGRRVDVLPNLYRYALVLPAGAAAKHGLVKGGAVAFTLPARAGPRRVLLPVTLSPPRRSAVTVRSELAATPEETAFGLMYRRTLPARGGMLFRFPRPQILQFYMRNTRIPLDMIFINDNRVVTGVVHRAKPFDESNRGVGPIQNRYVLEVRAGFARRYGITPGTAVTFRLPE